MTSNEKSRLEELDRVLRSNTMRMQIWPIISRVQAQLARKLEALMTWEPIPLQLFGGALPTEIRAGYSRLRAQLTGAADSIGDNIVEGCGAATNKEFARFLDMSIKSANETEGHLLKARDLNVMSQDTWQGCTAETVEIRKMTYSYRRKVLSSHREGK